MKLPLVAADGVDFDNARNRPQLRLDDPIMKRCLLYTSDAAVERSSVDLGGRGIIKKKKE